MKENSNNQQQPQQLEHNVSGITYEYRIIDHDMFDENEIQTMNYMGSKGWEIIRILDPMKWANSEGMFIRVYYKRYKGL